MQSRQPRLGDILDDYCPRERRLTNHAVVAMIGDEIRQTRCTTCDAEHVYKHARVPAQRKKTGTGALYDEVLAGGPAKLSPVVVPPPAAPPPVVTRPSLARAVEPTADESLPVPTPEPAAPVAPAPVTAARQGDEVDGPVHRQLIRATLPRPEGQVKERPIPEFTVRTAAAGRARFRPHGGGGQGQGHSRHGQAQGADGSHTGGNRAGRRGPGSFAATGGNPAQPPQQGERQGQGRRRRGSRARSK